MLALAADENINNDIVRALLRRRNDLDIVRVRDAGLTGADDRRVLEWAASEGRVLLTHDVSTITRLAYERIEDGLAMPGVFELAYDGRCATFPFDSRTASIVSGSPGMCR